jgi:hypothetical protein
MRAQWAILRGALKRGSLQQLACLGFAGAESAFPKCSEPIRKRTRSALYALAAETHCQASIPLTRWSLWHQAMADDNFGGMTPKGNVAWVPTALSALATMELA